MKTSSIVALVTAALAAASAQAMGSGHNPLQSSGVGRAEPIAIGGAEPAFCRAVPLAGTQQRAGGARGSCVVVKAGNPVGRAGGVHTRTLMQGGRSAQTVRVAAAR